MLACLGGPGARAAGDIALSVDLARAAPGPIYKSKLGFARAASFARLPESIAGLGEIRPRIFCSELDFDDVEAPRHALDPDPFLRPGTPIPASAWLQRLDGNLAALGIEPHYQLIGAPTPYQQKLIRRPAIHPTPTDIPRSARLTADWIAANFGGQRGRNWLLWNEPSHTLRGQPTSIAARDMAGIFAHYAEAIRAVDPDAQLGYASFIAHALTQVPEQQGTSFLARVFEYTNALAPLRDQLDFVSINSYFGRTEQLLQATNELLARYESTAPVILSQFAPPEVARKGSAKNTIASAIGYLEHYDAFVRDPGIKHVCFSYWTGASRQAFYRFDPVTRTFRHQLNYHALRLYQQLAPWRAAISPATAEIPAFAAFEDGRLTVLLANADTRTRRLALSTRGNPRPLLRGTMDVATRAGLARHGIGRATDAEPLTVELAPESLTLLSLADPGMPGASARHTAALAKHYVNNNTYVHRDAGTGPTGSSHFDAQLMAFMAETRVRADVAHSAARFERLPATVDITMQTPSPGELDAALACWSLHLVPARDASAALQVQDGSNDSHRGIARRLIRNLPAGTAIRDLAFTRTGSTATASVSTASLPSDLRVHAILANCASPTQVMIQLSHP